MCSNSEIMRENWFEQCIRGSMEALGLIGQLMVQTVYKGPNGGTMRQSISGLEH
jgi:hypothetical protein